MSDFFDRLEQQLNRSTRQLARQHAPATSRRLQGVIAVSLLVLLAAGTAIAATGIWRPILGMQRYGPGPSIASSPPPKAQLAMLAVLRRPQTPADRSAAVRRELRYVSGDLSGVRTDYIRKLAITQYGQPVILVPSAHFEDSLPGAPPAVKRLLPKTNALCIIYPERTLSEGVAAHCYTTRQVGSDQATGSLGNHQYGLVPDNISSVTWTYASGRTITTPVRENFFDMTTPRQPRSTPTVTFHRRHSLRPAES